MLNTSSVTMTINRFDAPLAQFCTHKNPKEERQQNAIQTLAIPSYRSSAFSLSISEDIAEQSSLNISQLSADVFRIDGSTVMIGTAMIENSDASDSQVRVQLPAELGTGIYLMRISDGSLVLPVVRLMIIE